MQNSENMRFILLGFDERAGVRRYAFQGIVERTRTDFTVKVDVGLVLKHRIRLQELPLLCRELLERRGGSAGQSTLTFTEEEMGNYSRKAREAAAQDKKDGRRSSRPAGSAWKHRNA